MSIGDSRMRIFIGLQEIAGYYTNLKKGFDVIGVPATFVNLEGHRFNYGTWYEKNPLWANGVNLFIQKIIFPLKRRSSFRRIWDEYLQTVLRVIIFLIVLLRYDVVIFSFGYSFFGLKDLKILKKFGKKIIFVFNGSDARPSFIDGYVMEQRNKFSVQDIFFLKVRKHALSIIESYADSIIVTPATGHHFTKPFIQFLAVGLPFSPKIKVSARRYNNDKIRILHSPSAPQAKGTPIIRKIISNLKSKGYGIDYIEIVNKTNSEVLEEIQKCDFIIDQVYSDLPLAGFATEAAYSGKPAVIGSYYADIIKQDIAREFIPPSAFCQPEKIQETVESLIKNAQYRKELGKKAQSFVRKHWSAENVARRFLKIIKGNVDKKWVYDPNKITYTYGAALPAQRVKKLVASAISLGSKEALYLNDKPSLEKLFVTMSKNE